MLRFGFHRGTAQDQCAFPLRSSLLKMLKGGTQRWTDLLFVAFCQLTGHLQGTIGSAGLHQVIKQVQQTVGRFVQNGCSLFLCDVPESLAAFNPFDRKKAFEAEPPAWKTAADKGGRGRTWAGDADHLMAIATCGGGQLLAGVTDSGEPSITDQSKTLTCDEQLEKLRQAGAGVVLVEAQAATCTKSTSISTLASMLAST